MYSPTTDVNPSGCFPARGGVVELALLLPGGQAAALEEAAYRQGRTVAQVLRSLVREYLTAPA
jgi:hypothetical protein